MDDTETEASSGASRPVKVLLVKLGLDGHDRGIKVVARALQKAGMDVRYLGMRISPEEAVDVAAREGADVIGVSLLSGAHKPLMEKLMRAVDERELRGEALILLGGTIPDKDVEVLQEMGVDGVFPVGSSLRDIERFIRERLAAKTQA